MEHSRRLNSHIILLSLCFSFLSVSSCKEQKVTIVMPKMEDGFGFLRLDYFSGQLDDTVIVDEDYIGILNCYKDTKLNGKMFEFVYFDEKDKKIKIPEFDYEKNKTDTSKIYFKHGMFIGRNNSDYILYFIGNSKYLMQISNNFDIDSPELEKKLDLGEAKISN